MQYTKSLLALVLISLIIFESCKPQAITISQSQVQAVFSDGSIIRVLEDSSMQPVNVGKTGVYNVYDFSKRPFYLAGSGTVYSVTKIPQLASRFPSNAVALKEGTVVIDYPVFSFSNQKFYEEGRGSKTTDRTESYEHNIPADELVRLPIKLNTAFSVKDIVVLDTTYINGLPTKSSSHTVSKTVSVDGFGKLLLPGGLSYECLRVRTVYSGPQDYKLFQYWTREGAIIHVISRASQPDTGIIGSGYVIYLSHQK
jgi:hypothetical protein